MSFFDMAMRVAEEQAMQASKDVQDASAEKKQAAELMDIQIGQLKLQENAAKQRTNEMKFTEKQRKLNDKLIQKLSRGQGNVFVGNQTIDQFAPEVDPDARDLPFVDVASSMA